MKRLILLFAAVVVLAAASCTKGSAPGSNLDVPDPEGTLEVNSRNLKVDSENSYARLIVTYKNPKGLYEPSAISVEPYVPGELDGINAVFDLTIGTYTVRAEKLSVTVTVRLWVPCFAVLCRTLSCCAVLGNVLTDSELLNQGCWISGSPDCVSC